VNVTYRLPVDWGNDITSVLGACLHRIDDPYYFIDVAPCFHGIREDGANLFLLVDDEDGADGVELWAAGRDFLVGGAFFSIEPRKLLECHYNYFIRPTETGEEEEGAQWVERCHLAPRINLTCK
jgi:hypothetical protein